MQFHRHLQAGTLLIPLIPNPPHSPKLKSRAVYRSAMFPPFMGKALHSIVFNEKVFPFVFHFSLAELFDEEVYVRWLRWLGKCFGKGKREISFIRE